MIRIVRLGSPRARGEGARLGTVRRPPHGVRKEDHARRDWPGFVKAYRREMKAAGAERLLDALARLSQRADFSVGCYCEREEGCHRSILRELLKEHGARVS